MYERISTIERVGEKPVANTGQVSGILATSGEASDGHILNIGGGQLKNGTPLLFNHDAIEGNLGSWTSFENDGDTIRGDAQIELDGIGEKAAWRNDVAFMVDQGHIPGFSIRWAETKAPLRRVDLSKSHPAYVDPETEKDFAKLYGLYFDKWRMLEGSIVTLPADQGALIGRMRDAKKEVSNQWARVLERMAGIAANEDESRKILESFDHININELEPIALEDGRTFYLPKELAEKLSTQERGASLEVEADAAPLNTGEPETPAESDRDAGASLFERDDLFELLKEEIAPMYQEVRKEWRELLYQTVGRV